MDRETARTISDVMLECTARMDDTIALVQRTCDDEEFRSYRKAMAGIMASVLLDVLNPLYERFPDLKPEQLL